MTQLQHEKRIYAARRGDRFPPNQKQPWEGYVHEALVDTCGRSVDRRGRDSISSVASGQGDGSITLLDSTKTGDWTEVGKANWAMKDGALVADKLDDAKVLSYLVSKDSYKDFQMKAEFWTDEEANSGIFIRCDVRDKIDAKVCYEVNIFDKRPDPSYGTGAIVDVAKVDPMPKAAGKWNTYEITAQGSHLVVVLNGQKTADVQDSKHNAGGPFALQYGSGVVKFRKVQIKSL